ncbi:hypothetical protein ACIPVK_16255 [Paeniglutamicibacter sp. MACA_103]|uniref:hypothetical protein n=1 Tax=Paeniglutamicibacter sp. MACA_103 TaxID=3377337 RepID=UPI003894829C
MNTNAMNNPIGSALHDAAEARQTGGNRIVQAMMAQKPYDAQVAQREAQAAIVRHRARVLVGARATIAKETQRLFGTAPLYTRRDPAREHETKARIEALNATLTTEQEAAKAFDQLLRKAHQGDNVEIAGGIAAKAMQEGWEGILGAWVSNPSLGRKKGGWSTVEAIKAAQGFLTGELHAVLQDMPSVEEVMAQARGKAKN